MLNKKYLNPLALVALAALVFAIIFKSQGNLLNDLAQRVFILMLFVLIVANYVLRIALVFIGVFAIYRALWKHVNNQQSRPMKAGQPYQNTQPTF